MKEIMERKAEMELELRALEENMKQYKSGNVSAGAGPPNTKVKCELNVFKNIFFIFVKDFF